jgi:tRNA uridine 5-carboxymethylaminomethyl modification enzyme
MFQEEYDVIVVVLDMLVLKPRQLPNRSNPLVTMSLQNIAQMSCNPAMGGIAKDK